MEAEISYREEMATLITKIHAYATDKKADFGLLPNGGLALYQEEDTSYSSRELMKKINGVLVESVFYRWNEEGFAATPAEDRNYFAESLVKPKESGLPVFCIDYTADKEATNDATGLAEAAGYASLVMPRRELDTIPTTPIPQVNNRDIKNLQEAKNFLALLNPGKFSGREDYLTSLAKTDYDLLIVDLYYGDTPLTVAEVARLQRKGNGGRRQVYAYMSVGEAEDYRPYWQDSWVSSLPDWLAPPNEDWAGSYHVRYWRPEWQKILFGSPDAYLDKIIAAGFDGAFLDVVDGYDYFAEQTL
ncbi:MAG: endo alpha-1,4 polygalactosaminidase [Selenomonadaceae bacterium]|nr:endo alpha-1,4 polygalactosaminidase [Selenomonadaceae bacterium]